MPLFQKDHDRRYRARLQLCLRFGVQGRHCISSCLSKAEGGAARSSASSMLRGRARPRVSGSSRVPSPLRGGQTILYYYNKKFFKTLILNQTEFFPRPGSRKEISSTVSWLTMAPSYMTQMRGNGWGGGGLRGLS